MTGLSGMTGFGRSGGEAEWGSWTWEAKAVNGRGLDVRVTVPSGFEGLDQAVKKLVSGMFTRGNVQFGLRIELAESASVAVNETVLEALFKAYEDRMGRQPEGDALATLLATRGVLDTSGSASSALRALGQDEAIRKRLLESAKDALSGLDTSRREEGVALQKLLIEALDQMASHKTEAESLAGAQPGLLKDRLETRLKELEAEQAVDADRLAAEVALTAAKADVREELDRLAAHIETGRGLLASGEPVGRKLDFLAQELNREANTLCSKSTMLDLTNAGLALKTLIDQFKEQAANVE